MEINRKVLTIDNMVSIIQGLTFNRNYKTLILSKEMKYLCELNSDFNIPSAWYVEDLKVNKNFKEKEFDLIFKLEELENEKE